MTTYRFTATPLTPIHVGDGSVLSPEDYLIEGDQLIRFNRSAVLRDMTPEQRRQLESALDQNQFGTAQTLIRKACKPERHGLSRSQIGEESRAELDQLVRNPQRACNVHPFVHNPITGQPYLPGSSIKGAIRTALVNHFSHTALDIEEMKQQVNGEGNRDRRWRTLETEALNFAFGKMEQDPCRLLKVGDVVLPPGSTRVDRALHWNRGKGGQEAKIQLHFERLLCRGDGQDIRFPVDITIDEVEAPGERRVRREVGRELDLQTLRLACNAFYVERMRAEKMRFFEEDEVPENRYGAKGLVQFRPGKLLVAKSIQQQGLLLRVGRFSQFESLSVDDLRKGYNIQASKEITEGSSRTLCRCRSGVDGVAQPLPFGWLLLRIDTQIHTG